VYPESLHHPKGARDRTIRHDPHEHMRAFGHQRRKVPEGVVSGLSLGKPAIGLLLCSMNQVREFDRILNEENRNVVSDQIPINYLREYRT